MLLRRDEGCGDGNVESLEEAPSEMSQHGLTGNGGNVCGTWTRRYFRARNVIWGAPMVGDLICGKVVSC